MKLKDCPCGGKMTLKYDDGIEYGVSWLYVKCDKCGLRTKSVPYIKDLNDWVIHEEDV